MNPQSPNPPDERTMAFERHLRELAPAAPTVDVASIAFEAGRRASQAQVTRWRISTALALVTACGLALWHTTNGPRAIPTPALASNPPSPVKPELASSPRVVPQDFDVLQSASPTLALREAVLHFGMNGLPSVDSSTGTGGNEPTYTPTSMNHLQGGAL
ncbi:MAG: hypothetical protein QM770_02205 [Tepidisphaeraceae bacterium]